MIKVLFVCVHNIARSQMAEAFLNSVANDKFLAESAGLDPGELSPFAVEVMKEIGIDISGNKSKSVFDMHKRGESFDHVITVCDEANAEKCPVFSGAQERIHWSFKDPSSLTGSKEDKMKEIRMIRDQIKNRIEKWVREIESGDVVV